jgi:HAD superfamily hydrolase (TIGR01484 family)
MKHELPDVFDLAPINELREIRARAFDIDDTFSSHGKIHNDAFSALWKAHEAGLLLVPITGRPAGWCDHIARFWPIDAIVGENGAFFMQKQNGAPLRTKYIEDETTRKTNAVRLTQLKSKLASQFPGIHFASDQDFRWFDLAIDFCEDVAPWSEAEIQRLLSFCAASGAHAKRSSIHVNTWFGDYDKARGFELVRSILPELPLSAWCYFGDSPNDEPMFQHFEKSVGVANIKPYLANLRSKPKWITEQESGAGFAAAVMKILEAQSVGQ